MIHVTPASEPVLPAFDFDARVRQRGRDWLLKKGLPTTGPVPTGVDLEPCWTACIPELRRAYREVCAYVGTWVAPVTGAATVEHFVAKSHAIEHAYEWSNYRFACSKMNSRKRDFTDVLDPFEVRDGWFEIDFVTMGVRPAPQLTPAIESAVRETIRRLKLDDTECRNERAAWWTPYTQAQISESFLAAKAPFVHREAKRQGLLRPA